MEFRLWLLEQMELNGWTQGEVGKKVGVSQVTVGQWLRGRNKPEPDTLVKIAELTHSNPVQIFNWVYGLPLPDSEAERDSDVEAILRKIAAMPADRRREAERYIDYLLEQARKNQDAEAGKG